MDINNLFREFMRDEEFAEAFNEPLEESIDWDKVQYGVHQFSTESIIFRGTEEECAKYIDDRPELWDDAEVYFMTPDDPHYIEEQNEQELKEDMNEIKKYIIFHHFNPDTLYLVKNIPDNSQIWDSDWIIEDVSNYNGQCMVSNNDEDIRVWEHPESLEEIDRKLYNIAKEYLDENPDEDGYWDEDYLLGGEITRKDIKKGINNFHIYSDWIEDSYVDGDSASQYQLMDLDDDQFDSYEELMGDDEYEDEEVDLEEIDLEEVDLEEDIGDKIYQITVKYHNEPNAKIEARSAKDRKDLEYQLNMDDEVEWYDFDEKQFNESVKEKIGPKSKQGILKIMDYLDGLSFEDLRKTSGGFAEDFPEVGLYFYFHDNDDVRKTFGVAELGSENFIAEEDIYSSRKSQANERDFNSKIKNIIEKVAEYFVANAHKLTEDCSLNESLDQMRQKALKMKENSNAFAILYGYRTRDGKEVELEPEEFATYEDYRDRIKQITDSFTKLSDKDPRGNRYGHEHNIEFYTVYPNKKQVSESTAINNNWKVKKSRIDTKKIDSIINNLISSFPIIGSKPTTIFKRHYKEKFVRYDIWLGHAGPGDAEAVEQKLLPSFEYLRDAVAPYGWKAFFEFSGYVGTDFFIQIRMPYETLENVAPIAVTESSYSDKNTNKWNIGSDKSKLNNEEMALLDELAQKLESSSVNGYKYVVQHTYEDFGAGMQWYTIVCYDKKGDSWQVLDTKEWLQLMNTGDVDAVYSEIVSGEYFKDKLEEATLDEMNHRQLMSYMDTLD